MELGGFFVMGVGTSDKAESIGVLRDGELHLDACMTAENGISFRAHLEIEGRTTDDFIDEN